VPAPDGGYPGFNTAEGQNALFNLTTGVGNTAVGWFSLRSDIDGSYNTAVGAGTLLFNVGNQSTSEGAQNTAIGTAALLNNTTGSFNMATGTFLTTTRPENTTLGAHAPGNNTAGNSNAAIGANALFSSTGNGNTALGQNAGRSVTTASNVTVIGAGVFGTNTDTSCFIGNIFSQSSPSGTAVFVNSDGKLGTTVSSRRFKDDIKPMAKTSEAILALKPVTFRYKKEFDPTGIAQFGLVAEDVEKINP